MADSVGGMTKRRDFVVVNGGGKEEGREEKEIGEFTKCEQKSAGARARALAS